MGSVFELGHSSYRLTLKLCKFELNFGLNLKKIKLGTKYINHNSFMSVFKTEDVNNGISIGILFYFIKILVWNKRLSNLNSEFNSSWNLCLLDKNW